MRGSLARPTVRAGLAIAALTAVMTLPTLGASQDPFEEARALYAAARYEEALSVLARLPGDGLVTVDAVTIEKHRALCLLALGREDDAEAAFATVVAIDPLYLPGTREVSPSVRSFFRAVRQRWLPDLARGRYELAKSAWDRGDHTRATEEFQLVVALLDDEDMAGRLTDLRLVATGFVELGRQRGAGAAATPVPGAAGAGVEAPSNAPVAPNPPAAPVEAADPDRIYSAADPGVTPPTTISQQTPPLSTSIAAIARSRGVLELVIDEQGRVTSVMIREPIHAAYDRDLLRTATRWRYEPATLNGTPVKYRKVIEITIR